MRTSARVRTTLVSSLACIAAASAVSAEEAPAPVTATPQLVITLRGAQRSFTDSIKGVMLEHDHTMWDLVILGAKARGQFTCELRSADRAMLFDLQRAILNAPDLTVNCANGTTTPRGGVLINLDDPAGGSFVLESRRR
jgi:hypothetical protein